MKKLFRSLPVIVNSLLVLGWSVSGSWLLWVHPEEERSAVGWWVGVIAALTVILTNIILKIYSNFLQRRSRARQARVRLLHQIQGLFAVVSCLVPTRLSKEELGDAEEQILQYLSQGRPIWLIWTRAISAVLWVLINAVREVVSAVLGRQHPKSPK